MVCPSTWKRQSLCNAAERGQVDKEHEQAQERRREVTVDRPQDRWCLSRQRAGWEEERDQQTFTHLSAKDWNQKVLNLGRMTLEGLGWPRWARAHVNAVTGKQAGSLAQSSTGWMETKLRPGVDTVEEGYWSFTLNGGVFQSKSIEKASQKWLYVLRKWVQSQSDFRRKHVVFV